MFDTGRYLRFMLSSIAVFALLSCASKPMPPAEEAVPEAVQLAAAPASSPEPDLEPEPVPPEPPPSLRLEYPLASAVALADVSIRFTAVAVNSASRSRTLESLDYELFVQGTSVARGSSEEGVLVEPGREAAFKLELPLSVRELEEKTDIAFREAEAVWRVDVRSRWTSSFEEAQEASASAEGRFPVISEPVFSIVSIKMKRAELINTRLKVALRVDNPNIFPVAFRSMSYELFGEGRSWADGVVENLVLVEGGGSAEAELSMTMNFIDMNRALLDRFIRLDKVSYRLKGEVVVGTGLDFLPEFRMKFDKAGVSSVSE